MGVTLITNLWTTITEGQGAVLNGLLTLISAVAGVLLGAVLFGNRVRDIETAIERSKETVELHFTKTEDTLAKVRDMAAELEAVVAALPAQLNRLEIAVEQQGDTSLDDASGIDLTDDPSTDELDPRANIRRDWARIRDHLEALATDPKIDGRTRAKYMRIDRRSYGDFIEALEHDDTITGSAARLAREAYSLRNSFKRRHAPPTTDELTRMQSLADQIIAER